MNAPFVDYLARCIHYHRKKSGLTQAQLAQFAGIGKTVVFDVEHNKNSVQLDTLLRILSVLNIDIQLDSPLMKEFQEKYNETN
ncbi:MAG: helix-turn-helix transcriptional regulator [Gammaproteobacteria bacterium]|nr:helix-turn-helix transcriptional regulator [Gammaproteobacteria bacterium]